MTTITLDEDDVRQAVSMPAAIDAIRRGFVGLAAGEFEMPVRTVLRDGQFLVMSAHHRPSATAMVKTLSLNFSRVPAISGTVVWSEAARADHLVAPAGVVTALRTGAAAGVATDLLAVPDASRLTLFGVGGQAADQVRAVRAVRPIHRLTVANTDPARARRFLEALGPELAGIDVHTTTDPVEAVADADVVCCATNTSEPLFPASALPRRVHVNAIGAYRPTMRELPDELLADSFIVVDEIGAILEESGEIIHALRAGALAVDDLVELGSALRSAPSTRAPRTVFKSVGIAMQDWVIARLLADAYLG